MDEELTLVVVVGRECAGIVLTETDCTEAIGLAECIELSIPVDWKEVGVTDWLYASIIGAVDETVG